MRVLVIVAVVVLVGAWLLALRAQLRRRQARDAEWRGGRDRLDLWVSGARCLSCGAGGGVMEQDGDALWFVCMRCGHRQRRRTRG